MDVGAIDPNTGQLLPDPDHGCWGH
jgi:hypothetical protein